MKKDVKKVKLKASLNQNSLHTFWNFLGYSWNASLLIQCFCLIQGVFMTCSQINPQIKEILSINGGFANLASPQSNCEDFTFHRDILITPTPLDTSSLYSFSSQFISFTVFFY